MPEYDTDNLFWKSPLLGMSKAADEVLSFGVEVKSFSFNQLQKSSYVAEFEKLIEDEPDAVIFTPLFFNETKKFVKKFEDKSIPYFFLNVDVEGFNNLSYIGQDSYKGGYLSAKLMHLSTGNNSTYLIAQTKSKFQKNSVIEQRVLGFSAYFNDHQILFQTIFLNFDDLDELKKVRTELSRIFKENIGIKGVLIPSSRISTISSCIAPEKLKDLSLIGFDTTEQNIACLEKNEITFLISQKSFNQGFKSVKMMVDYLIQNKVPPEKLYSPLEIITKENVEFSQQNKWLYSKKIKN